jgi:hypothetical protein
MSIQTSFSNSIFKAYKDLAAFGPMEFAMYERYTDIENKDKNKAKVEKKPMSTVMIIFLIILLVIIFTIGFIALSSSGFNPFFLFMNN